MLGLRRDIAGVIERRRVQARNAASVKKQRTVRGQTPTVSLTEAAAF